MSLSDAALWVGIGSSVVGILGPLLGAGGVALSRVCNRMTAQEVRLTSLETSMQALVADVREIRDWVVKSDA